MLDRILFLLGSSFGHLAMLLLAATWRVTVNGWDHVETAMRSGKPLVMITWHGRLMIMSWHVRDRGLVTMISQSRDGELVARVVQKLGFKVVRGSSSRGGAEAAREMLEAIQKGRVAAMICDGPRGPIYKMKPGAAFLAMQANAAVIPSIASADRAWIFRSWDRFMVPKPFARVRIYYGTAIQPADPAELKSLTRRLEESLNALLNHADLSSGRPA